MKPAVSIFMYSYLARVEQCWLFLELCCTPGPSRLPIPDLQASVLVGSRGLSLRENLTAFDRTQVT